MASVRKIAVSSNYKVKIIKWFVKHGQDVRKDSNLASYAYCDKKDSFITERKLKSRFDGKVADILYKSNVEVPPGAPVVAIEEEQCKHTIVMKEMCCECGADLRVEAGIPGNLAEPVAAEVSMVHNIPELRVSLEEAEQIAKSDEKKLLTSKKLALVVDLDQTLIHTTHEAIPEDLQDVFHFHLPDQPFEYHTKVRPGAKRFLETVSELYELHIFTMGSRLYAHTIARHLDPDEKLFAHRIRSRDECLDGFCKSQDLRALFPCGDHMVCIIDDREDVWNFAPNLVTVKPYRFFAGTGDINDPFANKEGTEGSKEQQKNLEIDENSSVNNTKGANKEKKDDVDGKEENQIQETKKDNKDPVAGNETADKGKNSLHDLDDYLYYLEEILERVHRAFYSTLEQIKTKGGLSHKDPEITQFCTSNSINPDTRAIIPALRKQTLKGASLVFTGVVPTNIPLTKSLPYRTAIELGASVTNEIISQKSKGKSPSLGLSEYSTHVVAARLGTEKAFRAGKLSHVKLVNPDWLWCCAQRWEWVEEQLFPVKSRDGANGISTPEVTGRGTPISGNNGSMKDAKAAYLLKKEGEKSQNPRMSDEILDNIVPSTFSKDELDEMDKEVEEYMLTDKDDDDDDDNDNDFLGSISGSTSRQSTSSRTDSSLSTNSSKSNQFVNSKRKQNGTEENDSFDNVTKKKSRVTKRDSSLYNNISKELITIDSDSSSEDSSDNGGSDSEDDIGALLERQISSGSPL